MTTPHEDKILTVEPENEGDEVEYEIQAYFGKPGDRKITVELHYEGKKGVLHKMPLAASGWVNFRHLRKEHFGNEKPQYNKLRYRLVEEAEEAEPEPAPEPEREPERTEERERPRRRERREPRPEPEPRRAEAAEGPEPAPREAQAEPRPSPPTPQPVDDHITRRPMDAGAYTEVTDLQRFYDRNARR